MSFFAILKKPVASWITWSFIINDDQFGPKLGQKLKPKQTKNDCFVENPI